jgi:hypothetical protein
MQFYQSSKTHSESESESDSNSSENNIFTAKIEIINYTSSCIKESKNNYNLAPLNVQITKLNDSASSKSFYLSENRNKPECVQEEKPTEKYETPGDINLCLSSKLHLNEIIFQLIDEMENKRKLPNALVIPSALKTYLTKNDPKWLNSLTSSYNSQSNTEKDAYQPEHVNTVNSEMETQTKPIKKSRFWFLKK